MIKATQMLRKENYVSVFHLPTQENIIDNWEYVSMPN